MILSVVRTVLVHPDQALPPRISGRIHNTVIITYIAPHRSKSMVHKALRILKDVLSLARAGVFIPFSRSHVSRATGQHANLSVNSLELKIKGQG